MPSGVERNGRSAPRGEHGRHLVNLAKDAAHGRECVADGDRQKGRSVGAIEQIAIGLLVRNRAAALHCAAGGDQGRRQHLADQAFGNEPTHMHDFGSDDGLCSDHAEHTLRSRQPRHLLGFGKAIAERPFAIDVLARPDRGFNDRKVRRYPHGDGDDVDIRRSDQCCGVGESMRYTGCGRRRLGARKARVGDAIEFEQAGKRAERGHVRA